MWLQAAATGVGKSGEHGKESGLDTVLWYLGTKDATVLLRAGGSPAGFR